MLEKLPPATRPRVRADRQGAMVGWRSTGAPVLVPIVSHRGTRRAQRQEHAVPLAERLPHQYLMMHRRIWRDDRLGQPDVQHERAPAITWIGRGRAEPGR